MLKPLFNLPGKSPYVVSGSCTNIPILIHNRPEPCSETRKTLQMPSRLLLVWTKSVSRKVFYAHGLRFSVVDFPSIGKQPQ